MEISLHKEEIFSGRILKLERHLVRLTDDSEAYREVVRHPGAVAVVAFKGEELLLVRQYRFPVQKFMLEMPAGKLDSGESPEDCARRELLEETGYGPVELEKLTVIETSPGFSDEAIHIFTCEVEKIGESDPDEGEFVEPVFMKIEEVVKRITDGSISDSKTISGVLLALRRKESQRPPAKAGS